jgi:hypothetical protein
LRKNPRDACVLLSFPAAMLYFLSRFRVHFARNALPLHGAYALLAALRLAAALQWSAQVLGRWWTRRQKTPLSPAHQRLLLGVAATLGCVLAVNRSGYQQQLHTSGDSRVAMRPWLKRQLRPGSVLLVPSELAIAPESLAGLSFKEEEFLKLSNAAELRSAAASAQATFMLWPEWGCDPRFGKHAELDRARALRVEGQELARFGTRPVLLNYPGAKEKVPWGDPAFAVVALKP